MSQLSSKTLSGFPNVDGTENATILPGLVQPSEGAIKAVNSGGRAQLESLAEGAHRDMLPPQNSSAGLPRAPPMYARGPPSPERMVIIPAGGLGKAAGRLGSPMKTPKRSNAGSSARSIDMPTRTNSRTPTREIDRLHVENRAPPRFICPISGRIMRDPVILTTGTTCDRGALERYLAKGHKRCPVTKRPLKKPIHLMPNIELRQNIAAWGTRNAPWIVDKDGLLEPNDPKPSELQGNDPQYVTPMKDDEAPGASGAGRSPTRGGGNYSPSRTDMGKGNWKYTNGNRVRPGNMSYNINASAGIPSTPWESHRGISSPPRSARRHRSVSRSLSPSKRVQAPARDRWSTAFLAIVALANIVLYIMSLWQNKWKMEPMTVNPWYGASADALTAVGASNPQLMWGASKQWWRMFSAPFLPAGLIQLLLSLAGLFFYGRYAQLALPLPQASVPGLYLLAALVGTLASANLNGYFVSCGTMAGISGLLGCVCIDQMLHFKKKKLMNLQEWWMVLFVLLINIGGFITASLVPMVDIWYTAGGLLVGLLASAALLVIPRVGKGKDGNAKWASIQITCIVLLALTFVAGVIGAALPMKVGQEVPVLKSASCMSFGSLSCVPYGYLPDGCGVQSEKSGLTLICPLSPSMPLPPGTALKIGDLTATAALCTQYCTAPAPGPGPDYVPTTVIESSPAEGPSDATTTQAASPPPSSSLMPALIPTPPTSITIGGGETSTSSPAPAIQIPGDATALPADTGATASVDAAAAALANAVSTASNSVMSAVGNAGRKLRAGFR